MKEEQTLYLSKDLKEAFFQLEQMEEEKSELQKENQKLSQLIRFLLKKQKVIAVERELPFS